MKLKIKLVSESNNNPSSMFRKIKHFCTQTNIIHRKLAGDTVELVIGDVKIRPYFEASSNSIMFARVIRHNMVNVLKNYSLSLKDNDHIVFRTLVSLVEDETGLVFDNATEQFR